MSPSDIISKLPGCFDKALSSGDLFFFPSTISKHEESGVEFEIRLCTALQKKPTIPALVSIPTSDAESLVRNGASQTTEPNVVVDPFAPPYNPNLHIGDLQDDDGEEYVVLLNKYSVISQHFLLVTKDYKSQSSPLLPPELVQIYLLLIAGRKAGKRLFAFYNCGENSGASQPHKHIQFIPLEDHDGPPIEGLARSVNIETPDKPFSLTKLPYANHVFRFPSNLSSTPNKLEETLSQAFLSLLDLVVSTIRHDPDYPPGKPSYNVIITLEHMHLIPRRQDTYVLQKTGEHLGVNALGFSGMLLVKSDVEMDSVKEETVGKILRGVGLKSVHDLQVAGTSNEGEELVAASVTAST